MYVVLFLDCILFYWLVYSYTSTNCGYFMEFLDYGFVPLACCKVIYWYIRKVLMFIHVFNRSTFWILLFLIVFYQIELILLKEHFSTLAPRLLGFVTQKKKKRSENLWLNRAIIMRLGRVALQQKGTTKRFHKLSDQESLLFLFHKGSHNTSVLKNINPFLSVQHVTYVTLKYQVS